MKLNIAYRISSATLALGSILCAFFLKFFTFTITMVIVNRTYNFSIFDAIGRLTGNSGGSASLDLTASEGFEKVRAVLDPMWNNAIAFFVLVAIACVFALAITVISASTNLHVPQAVLSAVGFILLVIAAGCGTSALGCLTGEEPSVSLAAIMTASLGELTTDNALSALGSAVSKVQIAALSYGLYVVLAIFAVLFIWSIIAGVKYNSDQPKRVGKKHRREYRRKKPMKKLSAIGK